MTNLNIWTLRYFIKRVGELSVSEFFIVFPAVSVVILVVRFFEFNSNGSWVGSLSMVGVVVCSHTIANELRKMQSPKPNKKIQPTAESGG